MPTTVIIEAAAPNLLFETLNFNYECYSPTLSVASGIFSSRVEGGGGVRGGPIFVKYQNPDLRSLFRDYSLNLFSAIFKTDIGK